MPCSYNKPPNPKGFVIASVGKWKMEMENSV